MLCRLALLSLLAVCAWANIIVNGDFEGSMSSPGLFNNINLNALAPQFWDVYGSIPGWSRNSGPGIEVQSNTVVPAHSGSRYVELDSDRTQLGNGTNSSMLQSVTLNPGVYVFSFWYRPRTNTPNDNKVTGSVGGLASIVADGVASDFPGWKQYSSTFTVTNPGTFDVVFAAGGIENRLGGFIDDVSLVEHVPEPATFGVLAGGLLALLASRGLRSRQS